MKDVSKRLPLTEACEDGRKYGLDISIVLMKALRNVDACDQFWQDPIVPVTATTVYLDELKITMDGANVCFRARTVPTCCSWPELRDMTRLST
jgi:hypothetical protein